jgi:AraC-like DNA-binding protein
MNSFAPLTSLSDLLKARLLVENARDQTYGAHWKVPVETVPTHRILLAVSGILHYQVEDYSFDLAAGQQLFVPAWSRRGWSTENPRCRLLWCEFTVETPAAPLDQPYRRYLTDPRLERQTLQRLAKLWSGRDRSPREALLLQLEAELKSVLARFWVEAEPLLPGGAATTSPSAPHPALQPALRWARQHYREPDALRRFPQPSGLSESHFRQVFQQALHCTPGEYLLRLRMRRARYLLEQGKLSVKQVAGDTGYADPLYFSRRYRKFWGTPPSGSG